MKFTDSMGKKFKDIDELTEGHKYTIDGLLTEGQYRGRSQYYIYEEIRDNYIITLLNHEKKNKFAIEMNDCANDGMKETQFAKMVCEIGDYVNFIEKESDSQTRNIYTFKVLGTDDGVLHLVLKEINSTITSKEWLSTIVEQAVSIIVKEAPIYFIDKVSFNGGRIIKYGYFAIDDKGDLSMTRNGKRYVLNLKSKAQRDEMGNPVKEGIYRFFFSTTFVDRDTILVDGYRIEDKYTSGFMDNDELEPIVDISGKVSEITTRSGGKFTILTQNSGKHRMIICYNGEYRMLFVGHEEIESIMIQEEKVY